MATLFVTMTWPIALSSLSQRNRTSEASDEQSSHWPTIQNFANRWPAVDQTFSRVAMIPGYHFALAGVYRLVGSQGVRLANTLISLALVVVVLGTAMHYAGAWLGSALTLPVICSPYVLGSAMWVTTDNAGWLLAMAVLADALRHSASPMRSVFRSVSASLGVLVRHVHLWIVVPMMLSGLDRRQVQPSQAALVSALLACVPPVVAVAAFVLIWHGMVPPEFQDKHGGGFNLATPVIALALTGMFGGFFAGRDVLKVWKSQGGKARWYMVAAAAMPLILPTDFNPEAGRWGGAIWEIVRSTPVVGGRAVVLVPLAAVGAAVLVVLYRRAAKADRAVEGRLLLLSLAAWVAAQTANLQAWQRYLEPGLLIGLAWLASLAASADVSPSRQPMRMLGPLALAMMLVGLDVGTLYWPVLR